MSRDQIHAVLLVMAEQNFDTHPAFESFCERMEHRQFGASQLDAAWAWYSDGWGAGYEKAIEQPDAGEALAAATLAEDGKQ